MILLDDESEKQSKDEDYKQKVKKLRAESSKFANFTDKQLYAIIDPKVFEKLRDMNYNGRIKYFQNLPVFKGFSSNFTQPVLSNIYQYFKMTPKGMHTNKETTQTRKVLKVIRKK